MELKEFYDKQYRLDEYILKSKGLNIEKEAMLAYLTQALLVEVAELANEVRAFKFWSSKKGYNRDKVLEEYVDVLHFFLSVGNNLGFSADEVAKAYVAKNDVNFNRQNNGY